VLKGEAKRDYMRDYMRRRRAGLATAKPPKPKPPWRPSKRMIETVRHWWYLAQHRPASLRQPSHSIIEDLDLDTDVDVEEACRRYQRYLEERRKQREREAQAAKVPAVKRCSFCMEPRKAAS
jgi:hypothetical protein